MSIINDKGNLFSLGKITQKIFSAKKAEESILGTPISAPDEKSLIELSGQDAFLPYWLEPENIFPGKRYEFESFLSFSLQEESDKVRIRRKTKKHLIKVLNNKHQQVSFEYENNIINLPFVDKYMIYYRPIFFMAVIEFCFSFLRESNEHEWKVLFKEI